MFYRRKIDITPLWSKSYGKKRVSTIFFFFNEIGYHFLVTYRVHFNQTSIKKRKLNNIISNMMDFGQIVNIIFGWPLTLFIQSIKKCVGYIRDNCTLSGTRLPSHCSVLLQTSWMAEQNDIKVGSG